MLVRVSIENFFLPTLRVQATKINPKSIPTGSSISLFVRLSKHSDPSPSLSPLLGAEGEAFAVLHAIEHAISTARPVILPLPVGGPG